MSSSARLALILLALAVTATAIAGCGGGGETTTVIERTVTEPAQDDADGEAGATTEVGDDVTGGAGDDGALPLNAFQSPSGNIGCVLSDGLARCDIAKRDWTAPRPAGCPAQSDFGQGLEVGRAGPGRVVCAGDTTLGVDIEVLPYRRVARSYGFTCFSRMAGITCADDATGHGFFISIQRYRLF